MIDFRYHLVSIIAVFLALAVGLVVGSTALSGKAEEALKVAQRNALANNKTLQKEKSALKQSGQRGSGLRTGCLAAPDRRPARAARRSSWSWPRRG